MAITYLSGGRIQGEFPLTTSLDTIVSTNSVRHDINYFNSSQNNTIALNAYAGNVIDTDHESIGYKLTSVTYRLCQTGTVNTDRPVVRLYTTGGVHKSTFTCEMNYTDFSASTSIATEVKFTWASNESGQDNEIDEDDEVRLYATDMASAVLRIFSYDSQSPTTAAKLHETNNGSANTAAFYQCELQYDYPNKIIDGSDTVLIFRESGTFTPASSFNVEVLVVAGGGGTVGSVSSAAGAGGMSEKASHGVTAKSYSVIVGKGGRAGTGGGVKGDSVTFGARASNGEGSSFDGIYSLGGGSGSGTVTTYRDGFNGGSGGGDWYNGGSSGGASTQGNYNGATGYGNAGGNYSGGTYTTGGGGGAGGAGQTWTQDQGRGGSGKDNDITGRTVKYAGGGGGGSHASSSGSGVGGLANGGGGQGADGLNGAWNKKCMGGLNGLGGGAGGNCNESDFGEGSDIGRMSQYMGKEGGSGVVILRFSTSGNSYTATQFVNDIDADLDVQTGSRFEDTQHKRIYRQGSARTITSEAWSGYDLALGKTISSRTAVKIGMQVWEGNPMLDKTVKSMSFWLWKSSSPTGNGYMQIMDGRGAIVATSTNTISWSGLGTTSGGTQQTFNFNGHKIEKNDCFLIVGGSTSDTNRVNVLMGTSDGDDNCAFYWNNDDWRGYATTPVKHEMTYDTAWVGQGVV